MKKTYLTEMPDNIGAFLQASRCFSALGINITRVSYNKAIDSHMLFIDAEGTEEQLLKADVQLENIGYLPKNKTESQIVLLEFKLSDTPGSVTEILSIIDEFHFNISYINSQEDGTGFQLFRMGLFVDNTNALETFISNVETICPVEIIGYNPSEKVFDNSIFYHSYIAGLSDMLDIESEGQKELLVNVNLVMQTLDKRNLSPHKTFDSIYALSELLSESRGDNFNPRITEYEICENGKIILVEPDCGSNTAILMSDDDVLFIDTGYAYCMSEMQTLLRSILPNFDSMKKTVLITHADVDHCGLLPIFDEIIASKRTFECLKAEYDGRNGFREQNPIHKPYVRMCKILTSYVCPNPDKIRVPWDDASLKEPLTKIGKFEFGIFDFTVYEGKGGHLLGEIILIDFKNKIVFPGDIYVNLKEMTEKQKTYNKYAPILMTSVDTDPVLCAEERGAMFSLLEGEDWLIFGAHGAPKKS